MKKLLLIIAIVLLAACRNKPAQVRGGKSKQDSIDSITMRDTNKRLVLDGKIDTDAFTLQEEKIAYGNIRFGISEKKYNKISKIEDKIGNADYFFSATFNHRNQLYKLRITSISESADYLNTHVKDYVENIERVITNKFGRPYLTDQYPEITEFGDYHIKLTNSWTVGTKSIEVGVREYEAEYGAVCYIISMPLDDEQREFEQKKDAKSQKVDASKF